jgi:hypothetical protein
MGEPPDSPPSGPHALPELPPPPPESGEAYQPLSMLALVGFALAALYGAIVLIGAVLAIGRGPLLLPIWTLLVPFAAALISWMGRSRILASENTLSGLALTRWGVVLGVLFGASYAAYYAATYAAISQQAQQFAQQWLEALCQGKVEKAFWLTQTPPRKPPEGPGRDDLEIIYNSQLDQGMKGPYTNFSQSPLVRMLVMDGPRTRIEPQGVQSWAYETGGFRVELAFRIYSPLETYTVLVTTHGATSPNKEYPGRQWRVLADANFTRQVPGEQLKVTEEGQDLLQLAQVVKAFANGWVQRLVERRDVEEALLGTLEPEDRKPLDAPRKQALLAGLAAGWPVTRDPAVQRYLAARAGFFSGKLVNSRSSDEGGDFWADPRQRQQIVARVEQIFLPNSPGDLTRVSPANQSRPLIEKLDRGWRFGCDVQLVLPPIRVPEPGKPPEMPFVVDALVEIDAVPEKDGQRVPVQLRVVELRLIRGRTAPPPPRGPGGQ